MKFLVVGLGGFVGANARYIVGGWIQQRYGVAFPYGTFLINVTGSFILGLFATLAVHYAWNDNARLFIAIGFVGAYTTFSTFEYETLQLIVHGRQYQAALVNLVGSVIVGMGAAYLGIALAQSIFRPRI